MNEVKVALVGFGGIARTHNKSYAQLAAEGFPVKLVAVCDKDAARFKKAENFNLGKDTTPITEDAEIYTDIDEMIAKADFDMADICLPSFLHKEVACKMLAAGKHVLSEKPMALSSAQCEEMLRTRDETGRKLMIAQCLRFDPKYLFLKECIDTGRFGSLKNLFMERLSSYPKWGADKWFESTEKCGGCILDTHIHDIDMARFLLGEPELVSSIAYDDISRWQVVNTRLYYKDLTVIANGSWDEAYTIPFHMGFRARFEKASVVLDGSELKVFPNDGTPYTPDISGANCYTEEIRFFANLIMDENMKNTCNPAESAYHSVKLVEALRRSVALGGERVVLM